MSKIAIILISVCCLIFDVYGHKPDFIKPCIWSDEKCMVSSSQHALPYIANGVEEYDMPPMDPIKFKKIEIHESGLDLILNELTVTGLKQCIVKSASRDIKASTVKMVLHCPILAVGEYIANGTLQFIPVTGAGPCKFQTDEIKVSLLIHINKVDGSDGKKHWNVKKLEHTYEPVKVFNIDLGNLYDGDEEKAKPIKDILHNNWKDMLLNMGKPIVEQVIQKLAEILGKFIKVVEAEHLEIAS